MTTRRIPTIPTLKLITDETTPEEREKLAHEQREAERVRIKTANKALRAKGGRLTPDRVLAETLERWYDARHDFDLYRDPTRWPKSKPKRDLTMGMNVAYGKAIALEGIVRLLGGNVPS